MAQEIRYHPLRTVFCLLFYDLRKTGNNGIVVFCAFECCMSHTLAQIYKFVMEFKTMACPLVEVCYSIMVAEFVGGGVGCIGFAP